MVKGVSRSGEGSNTQTTPPQQLPTMQAGQLPSDPLTVLNGPMGHGIMAGFNPFADMGVNTNDPNMVRVMSILARLLVLIILIALMMGCHTTVPGNARQPSISSTDV